MKIKHVPEISYIVSSYSWVDQLPTCLYSLRAQTHEDFEVVVTDNSAEPKAVKLQKSIVNGMHDPRFKYLHTAPLIPTSDCYYSSEEGMKRASGRWLCFPTEDAYYPPEWARRMLTVAMRDGADLVLCGNSITGPRTCGIDGYAHLRLGTASYPGYKPSFIVRRDKFGGWVNKPLVSGCSGVDRTTLQYLMRRGDVRTGVCAEVWYVHN